jgi:dimethylaniline monooxygenase (N-oxide forming)
MRSVQRGPRAVAVIGGGPGGLVAARYLQAHGFDPTIFEQSGDVGGQWNARAPHSGIWPGMRTNTSRVMTRFGDLDYPPGTATYPRSDEVLDYLRRYAERFELGARLELETRVERLERGASGWTLRCARGHGDATVETFPYVVVASGRFNRGAIPDLPGLGSFSGAGGAQHAFHYKQPEHYRGMRVLVLGCAISALEIAADVAMTGAERVVSAFRRQRYILTKLAAGVPTDHLAFTRFGALAREWLPADVHGAWLRDLVVRTSGSPEQFGAFRPAADIFEAGLTLSQHYLPLVAEGRIAPRSWPREVDGARVRFADGAEEEFDAVILGTGYEVSVPFLGREVAETIGLDAKHIELFDQTFHPQLEGLAFLGLFDQSGPYFPVLELQARWIAYAWANVVAPPSHEEMAKGIEAYRLRRGQDQKQAMHRLALVFARAAGVEPDLERWPEIARALLFGPLSATSFRLSGPDSLDDALERYGEDAAAFGAIASPEFTAEERARVATLAGALGDTNLARVLRDVVGL